ncbi:unnamed protein product [Parascedosporium putredinis]|uniref:GED domain-containing protein n=1 Tax=Parascedosporium putredinis TaxID=1442378 RepID=A0A9P1GXU0_9PEZI|nr:unnamed protein product [Parascedosporium putredinis]CAI7990989.1 unnamed protein product [Parascedosporium putredinis]
MEEVPDAIDEAKAELGIDKHTRDMFPDVLRIEITAPNVPNLTLVDLPGLYNNESQRQSLEGKRVAFKLAEKYMGQKRSIILAVVSAAGNVVMDQAITLAKKKTVDPTLSRVLGIITQLDVIDRNQAGPWQNYSPGNKGIGTLHKKLIKISREHISESLPRVVLDIEAAIAQRAVAIDSLGASRNDVSDVQFDHQPLGTGNLHVRKFRAFIREINRAFSTIMLSKGHKFAIQWDNGQSMVSGYESPLRPDIDPLIRQYYAELKDPESISESAVKQRWSSKIEKLESALKEESEEVRRFIDTGKSKREAILDNPEYGREYVTYLKSELAMRGNSLTKESSDFALEKTIDNMIVYYEHHRTIFIENLIILAAEKQLIRDIPTILDWKSFDRMDESTLRALAGEAPEVQRERDQLIIEKEELEKGLELCQKYFRQSQGSHHITPKVLATGTADFKYFWELQPVNRSISGDGDTFPDHTQGIQTSGTFEGSDPVINIFDTKAVINATTKEWFLYWHLFITYNCTPAAEGADDTSPTLAEEIPRAMGAFNLYFDDEGKLPDIYTPSSSKGEDTNYWRNWTLYEDVNALLQCNRPPKIVNLAISLAELSDPIKRLARAFVSHQEENFDPIAKWNREGGFGGDMIYEVDLQVGRADTDRDVSTPQLITSARDL